MTALTRKAIHERTAALLRRIQVAKADRRALAALVIDARAAVSAELRYGLVDLERALVEADEIEAEADVLLREAL